MKKPHWSVVIPFGSSDEAKKAAKTAKEMVEKKLYFDCIVMSIDMEFPN